MFDRLLSRRLLLGAGVAARFLLPDRAGAAPLAHDAARDAARGSGAGLPLVLLDPGHGGKDPGAIGVSGTYEKHIAFATAQELQRQLRSGGQYRVELTRKGDVFIPLEDRVGIAQHQGAALFVSMHADAMADHGVRGASVYTLADTASDAQTAALARARTPPTASPAPASATPRPRLPASWPAWCARRPGPVRRGWPAAWWAHSGTTCRCCRTRPAMPASWC